MNTKISIILFLFITITLGLFSSCRSESDELPQIVDNGFLQPDSRITNFILRAATNDGALDDSLDKSSCFTVKFPYTITVTGVQTTLASIVELRTFEASYNPSNPVTYSFPITLVYGDFSEVLVNDNTQFVQLVNTCNDTDENIACIDFEYPFSASGFDSQVELIRTINFEKDLDLYQFIDDLKRDDLITIDFPITVNISDGAVLRVSSIGELENTFDDVLRNRCDNASN